MTATRRAPRPAGGEPAVLRIPANEAAERAVLGAVLADAECFDRVASTIAPDDFYSDANKSIFEAYRTLAETGIPIDLIATTEQLERSGTLAATGGHAYVAALAEGLPDVANVEYYATILRDRSVKRSLLRISQDLAAAVAGDNGNSEAALAAVKAEMAAVIEGGFGSKGPVAGPELLAHLGVRCLSGISTAAPAELRVGCLDPDGHTVFFGAGGAGKGVEACHLAVKLVREGDIVMVADYENHATEWSRRISSLGGPLAAAGVYHVSPMAATWKGKRGAIWDNAAELRAAAETIHATYMMVDSIIPACGAVDPMKPEAASQYAAALQYIGLPTLSLAHVTKTDDLRYPFGSIFWHNLARTTWSLAPTGSGGAHEIVLTHRKHNNYASMGKFLVTITWADGLPTEVVERGYTPALADRIAEALAEADGALTVNEATDAINEPLDEGAEKFNRDTVKRTLNRHTKGRDGKPALFNVTGDKEKRYSNV